MYTCFFIFLSYPDSLELRFSFLPARHQITLPLRYRGQSSIFRVFRHAILELTFGTFRSFFRQHLSFPVGNHVSRIVAIRNLRVVVGLRIGGVGGVTLYTRFCDTHKIVVVMVEWSDVVSCVCGWVAVLVWSSTVVVSTSECVYMCWFVF